jgi:DEAD/DEAH box helicase domain-containing protein
VHQATAIDALLLRRRHTVVATPTASGKSVCYNAPVFEALAADRQATALYLFPTKALAQDQLAALRAMLGAAFGPAAADLAQVRVCARVCVRVRLHAREVL